MWRLTVRALLRVDVYGINNTSNQDTRNCPFDFDQPGLKDIITMLEERSRSRHAQLDAMVASGAVEHVAGCGMYVPLSSETDKPTCLKIIDIAKKSIDDLVIP